MGYVIGRKIPCSEQSKMILFKKEEIFLFLFFRGTEFQSSDRALTIEYIEYYVAFKENVKEYLQRLEELEIIRENKKISQNNEKLEKVNNVDDETIQKIKGYYENEIK